MGGERRSYGKRFKGGIAGGSSGDDHEIDGEDGNEGTNDEEEDAEGPTGHVDRAGNGESASSKSGGTEIEDGSSDGSRTKYFLKARMDEWKHV